MKKFS